jgi:hypothetical protein
VFSTSGKRTTQTGANVTSTPGTKGAGAADPKLTGGMTRILNHDLRPEVFTPSFALATAAGAFRHGRGHRRAIAKELLATAR